MQGALFQPPPHWRASKRKATALPKRHLFSTTRPKVDSADVEVTISTDLLNVELRCPICLDIMRDPMATPCLHRFCSVCIEKCLRIGKQECPSCRQPVATRRALRRDDNFGRLVLTFYPDLHQLEVEEKQLIDELSQSHRLLHAEKMRTLLAARVKQQRMAAAHKTFFHEVEPRQAETKEPSSDGDGEGTAPDESGSEGPGDDGEEGEDGSEEEGEGEDACNEPMEVEAKAGAQDPQAAFATAAPRRGRGRGAAFGYPRGRAGAGRAGAALASSRGGGRGAVRRKPQQGELKPRKFEFGFWLQPHPKEEEMAVITKSYVVTARNAHVRHVQQFVSDKLVGVTPQQVELSTKKSSGQRVLLKPNTSLMDVLVEYGLDPVAMVFDYRRKR
jgi:hypothetical protein